MGFPDLASAVREHRAGTSAPSDSLRGGTGVLTYRHNSGGAKGEENDGRCGVNLQEVLRAGFLFWFLVLCALGSAVFFVLAIDNGDRPLAWYAAIAFVLICGAAVVELVGF
jgi:hypothetical protein